ncbi:CPBP family intramembrane glutamic endopeptidase [Actinomadura sp. GTD37]|uniref:CPBP family intramembrane glutamic endopeptidase n=1 Tax=Actinomadura sp. GTD37 TaxID=1778030 RepID=UPI0035C0F95C
MEISPDFSAFGLVLTVPLIGYVLVEWLVGKLSYDRMVRDRDRDPKALVRMFRMWIAMAWASALAVLAVLVASPGVAASDLGLALPDEPGRAAGMFIAIAVAAPLVLFFLRRESRKSVPRVAQSAVTEMHPRTSTERWYTLGMSVTAGVCEELVYRGFLIAFGVGVLGLGVKTAAGAALVLFVIGHLYQGWRGVLPVAAIGYLLTYLYVTSGSLLVPVGLHVAIDVFALVVVPMVAGRTAQAAPETARS